MLYLTLGLIAGLIIGGNAPLVIPVALSRYTAIGILGILDSLLGALKAEKQKNYNNLIFLSGLVFNLVLAIGITWLGDALNLDLYLAAIIVFTLRIFRNLGTLRYAFLEPWLGKKRASEQIKHKTL